jgi:uncharacterized protein YerC
MSPKVEEKVIEIFTESIKKVQSSGEVVSFLTDLLTPTEQVMLSKRVAIAFLLLKEDYNYREISRTIKVSMGTIAKVHAVLALQGRGYRNILDKIIRKQKVNKIISELSNLVNYKPGRGQSIGDTSYNKYKRKSQRNKENPI